MIDELKIAMARLWPSWIVLSVVLGLAIAIVLVFGH